MSPRYHAGGGRARPSVGRKILEDLRPSAEVVVLHNEHRLTFGFSAEGEAESVSSKCPRENGNAVTITVVLALNINDRVLPTDLITYVDEVHGGRAPPALPLLRMIESPTTIPLDWARVQ